MGFFSKIKDNLTHGGVKVEIVAPEKVEPDQNKVPVEVRLTGGEETHMISSVGASIHRRFDNVTDDKGNDIQPSDYEIASQLNSTPFELPAHQTISIQLSIPLDRANIAGPDSSSPLSGNRRWEYTHYVDASPNVEGIALDPAKSKRIFIVGLESRYSLNIKL